MRRLLVALAALGLVVTPADASDFSEIGDPSFARTAMLSPKRFEEALCVSMALYESRSKPAAHRLDTQKLRDVMVARLAEEIGSAEAAADMLDTRAQWANLDDVDARDRAKKKKDIAEFTASCRPLYDAFRTGGATGFAAALTPSSGLIPLRSMATCMAIAEEQAIQTVDGPKMIGRVELEELRILAVRGLSPAERDSYETSLAAERRRFARSQADLQGELIPCYATFRLRAEAAQTGAD